MNNPHLEGNSKMADITKPTPDPTPVSAKDRDARGTKLVETIAAFAQSQHIASQKAPKWVYVIVDLLWSILFA
jgi:hypothetical protein